MKYFSDFHKNKIYKHFFTLSILEITVLLRVEYRLCKTSKQIHNKITLQMAFL